MHKICVVGTGYVGLVTGACLAELGNTVTCLDIVPEKIARLQAGELPIYEPGLDRLVARTTAADRLRFTTDYALALAGARFIFIAVNTPSLPGGTAADMSYVERAARAIAEHLDHDTILINKSTMPVGSGDLVSRIVAEHVRVAGLHTSVVANPEFLREGQAVSDFLHPDRVVLGSTDPAAAQAVAQLYLSLRAPMVLTDLYTAEMIKYASNAFLATKISFINELARLCERVGADVTEVAAGMGYDRRIGRAFLDAGLGYGGSCFPKDVKALAHMAAEAGLHPQLLEAVMRINSDQRHLVLDKLRAELAVVSRAVGAPGDLEAEPTGAAPGEHLAGQRIAVLGLAFKADTDDLREAPAHDIIGWLVQAGAVVRTHDPVAMANAQATWTGDWPAEAVSYEADPYTAATGCAAVVVLTEWAAYRELDLARLRAVMDQAQPILIDGRNLFDPAELARLGFRYQGIGRPNGKRHEAHARNGHHALGSTPATATAPRKPAAVSAGGAAGRAKRARQNGTA